MIEASLVKPIVDAVVAGLKKIQGARLKKGAAADLSEVIRNLLQINPNLTDAEAKIQFAKAAGIITQDLVLAEKMLTSVKVKPQPVAKKAAAKVAKKAAAKVAKKAAAKVVPKTRAVAGGKPSVSSAFKKAPSAAGKRSAKSFTKLK